LLNTFSVSIKTDIFLRSIVLYVMYINRFLHVKSSIISWDKLNLILFLEWKHCLKKSQKIKFCCCCFFFFGSAGVWTQVLCSTTRAMPPMSNTVFGAEIYLFTYLRMYLFICIAMVWIHGLTLARQVIYHLSHAKI
jgi:hypothetical protein